MRELKGHEEGMFRLTNHQVDRLVKQGIEGDLITNGLITQIENYKMIIQSLLDNR